MFDHKMQVSQIASFTKDGDSPFHWLAYGDQGRGATLEFMFNPFAKYQCFYP
jgi:hypothetical protein